MNAPGADGTISTTQANLFFQDLAASLKLVEWEKPLEHLMGVIGQVKYEEFLQIFLAISAVSRERKLLKIDDELMAKEDSTSEASSDEEDVSTSLWNSFLFSLLIPLCSKRFLLVAALMHGVLLLWKVRESASTISRWSSSLAFCRI